MDGPGRPTLYRPQFAEQACTFWLRNRMPELSRSSPVVIGGVDCTP